MEGIPTTFRAIPFTSKSIDCSYPGLLISSTMRRWSFVFFEIIRVNIKIVALLAFALLSSSSIAFSQETGLCKGDFDCDFDVDGIDSAIFKQNYGGDQSNDFCTTTNPCYGDFDCDGDVDDNDKNIFVGDYARSFYNNSCSACQKIVCDYPERCIGDCYATYPNFCPNWNASNCASGKCGFWAEGISVEDKIKCIGNSPEDDPCDENYLGPGCCHLGNGWYCSNGYSGNVWGERKVCCEGVLKEGWSCECAYVESEVTELQIDDCCTGKAGLYETGEMSCILDQSYLGPDSCFWLEHNGELYVHEGYLNEFFNINHICEDGVKKKIPIPCTERYFGEEMIGRVTSSSAIINMVPCQGDLSVYAEYGRNSGTYEKQTPVVTGITTRAALEIELTELEPETRYYYRVMEKSSDQTVYSPRKEGFFITKRNPGSSFSFAVTSDNHFHQIRNHQSEILLFERTFQNIYEDTVDFHIDLGDSFCTDYGITYYHELDIKNQIDGFTRYEDLRKLYDKTHHSIPFYFVLGNHEGELGFYFEDLAHWSENARKVYAPNPDSNTYPEGGSDDENFYAFTWGDALFIVLDPLRFTINEPTGEGSIEDWTLGSGQKDWLQKTLEDSNEKYKLIFIHHLTGGCIGYNYGRGGVECLELGEWGSLIHPMLVDNNVTIVFHGHDHAFADESQDGIRYTLVPIPHTGEREHARGEFYDTNGDLQNLYQEVLSNPGHINVTIDDSVTVQYIGSSLDDNNKNIKHSYVVE